MAGSVGAMEVEMQFGADIRRLSPRELGLLGIANVAYVKQVVHEGAEAFAIHAADGTQMAIIADRNLAFAVVRHHDLEPVSVH
jgi:hypothetical protein